MNLTIKRLEIALQKPELHTNNNNTIYFKLTNVSLLILPNQEKF